MNTLQQSTSRTYRGVVILTPLEYDHAALRAKFYARRDLHVGRMCRELKISRPTFYDVINGQVNVSARILNAITEYLDRFELPAK